MTVVVGEVEKGEEGVRWLVIKFSSPFKVIRNSLTLDGSFGPFYLMLNVTWC